MFAPQTRMITGAWPRVLNRWRTPVSISRSLRPAGRAGSGSDSSAAARMSSPNWVRTRSSRSTRNSQGWLLWALDARVAAQISRSTASSGIGSGHRYRIARAEPIAPRASIASVMR